ncbi:MULTISPECIES: hypothetical protein [Saliphagus]|uniref:Cox cluster protein n=1 Tax=Saliphagus infecundisoli TaxID=1849069 RepID=A0ABD5QFX1_9EURY|nr:MULTISPECIES: hypothetical protein [Saliphagus]
MSRSDDGYVHDPANADGERREDGPEREGESLEGVHPTAAEREFGRRGWVLVGVIVVAFIVSPLAIVLWPPETNYVVAFLILPLAPALALAVAAVWATTRP